MAVGSTSTERIKLLATFFNSIGVALVSLGVFAPLIYQATTLESAPSEKQSLLYGVVAVCMIGAAILHFLGQAMLGFLEEPGSLEANE